VTVWHAVTLPGPRGSSSDTVARAIEASGAGGEIRQFDSPRDGLAEARRRVGEGDRIIVFGSFLTVADALTLIHAETRRPATAIP